MKQTTAKEARRSWTWLAPLLAPMLGAGLLILGLIALGKTARHHLRPPVRDTIPFADIDCQPPPRQDRADFLDEVQYLSGMPNRLPIQDEGLPTRLHDAFARHPWVERVERVERVAPSRLRVQLRYRQPVLAVPYAGQVRAVDRAGILLPATADTKGLKVFAGEAPAPAGPAGTPWGNAAVEQAARAAHGP